MPAAPSTVAVVLSTTVTVGTLSGVAAGSAAVGAAASAGSTVVAGIVAVVMWGMTLRHGRLTGCYPSTGTCRFEQVAAPSAPAVQLRLFDQTRDHRSAS